MITTSYIDQSIRNLKYDTYTSLFTVNLQSNSDSGAIHLIGKRPCNHIFTQHDRQNGIFGVDLLKSVTLCTEIEQVKRNLLEGLGH